MKSIATLAFVLVMGGFVGAGSMPAQHGYTTGLGWGTYVSGQAQTGTWGSTMSSGISNGQQGAAMRAQHSQAPVL